jgi:hypothetical protein
MECTLSTGTVLVGAGIAEDDEEEGERGWAMRRKKEKKI